MKSLTNLHMFYYLISNVFSKNPTNNFAKNAFYARIQAYKTVTNY